MTKGWNPVVISDELYEAAKEYYEQNEEQLKLRHGIRSLTAFMNHCIREYMINRHGERRC